MERAARISDVPASSTKGTNRRYRLAIAAITGFALALAGLGIVAPPQAVHAASTVTQTTKGHHNSHAPDETTVGPTGKGKPASKVRPEFVSTDGSSWAWQNPSIQGNSLNGISCAAAGYCTAVGDGGTILITTNSGVTWSAQTPATAATLYGVTCTSTTACVATGAAGTIETSSGSTWTSRTSNVTVRLSAVNCPSSSTCFVVGDGGTILKTTNSGSTWSSLTSGVPSVNLDGINCTSTTSCTAVGTQGTILTYNGTSWSSATSGTGETLRAATCTSSSFCVVSGNHGTIVTYNGTSWTLQSRHTVNNLASVVCVSTTSCEAVGDAGTAYVGTSPSSWTAQTSNTTSDLHGVSCYGTSPEQCWAVGTVGAIVYTGSTSTVYAGSSNTWAPQERSATVNDLAAVACPSAGTCVAVGTNGAAVGGVAMPNGGTFWSGQSTSTTNPLTGVACPSTTVCWVAGENASTGQPYVLKLTASGNTWSPTSVSVSWTGTPFGYFNGISCTSTSFCVAVGDGGVTAKYNGTSWTGTAPSPATANLNGVTCLSTTACVAVGDSGTISDYNGTSWSSATSGTSNFLTAVSCVTSTGPCAAVGALGTWQYNSSLTGNFSSNTHATGTSQDLLSVSCPSSSSCTGVGEGGTVLTTTSVSGSFSHPASGTPNALEGVTCTTSNCISVGNPGTIISSSSPVQNEDMFAISTGNNGFMATWVGGSMTSWTGIHGSTNGSITGLWNPMLGQWDVYSTAGSGSSQAIYYTSAVPGGSWPSSWTQLANGSSTNTASTVGADLRPDGYEDVYVMANPSSNTPYWAVVHNGSQVVSFAAMGSSAHVDGSPVGVWNGGEIDNYGVGTDGNVYWETNATGSWTCLSSCAVHSGSGVVTTNLRNDGTPTHEDVFVEGTDGHSYQMTTTSGSSTLVSGPTNMSGGVVGPASGDWDPSTQYATVIGTDNNIWRNYWNGTGWNGWSGPTCGPSGSCSPGNIGGTFLSFTNR